MRSEEMNKTGSPHVKRKGLTLLEIVISFIILSIGVFSIMGVLPSITAFSENSRNIDRASILAGEKLDELTMANRFIGAEPEQDCPPELYLCTRKWWGAPPAKPGPMALQEVYVEVSWSFRDKRKIMVVKGLLGPLPVPQ